LIVGWSGRFLFFVVPQFSQGIGEWPENQILIPDWTYFHCPGTTLVLFRNTTLFYRCFALGFLVDAGKRKEESFMQT